MTRTLRDQILDNIEQAKKEHGKDWRIYFFNNFFNRLPGSYERLEIMKERFKDNPENYEYNEKTYDIPFKELYGDSRYSSLRISQSRRQFHKTIDDVFDELQINPKPIIEAQAKLMSNVKDYYPDSLVKDFEKKIIEVYIKLREKGYNHYPDLTA